jgi:hypothetical protein
LTNIDNELYCYSNEFHSHLPFDRLCANPHVEFKCALHQVFYQILYAYLITYPSNFPCGRKLENPGLSAVRWLILFTRVHIERIKRACYNDCVTEAPCSLKHIHGKKRRARCSTWLNNVLLPTLFTLVNNIEQYCRAWIGCNNIVQYCW